MIVERITSGLFIQTSNESETEIVTVDDVKAKLNIDFIAHDALINDILKQCRGQIEQKINRSLVSRNVVAVWKEAFDWIEIPFSPVTGALTVTDLDDAAIETEYKVVGNKVYGDFENGLKLTYSTDVFTNERVKRALIDMTAEKFTDRDTPIYELLKMHAINLI
jgi:hypothetical protein